MSDLDKAIRDARQRWGARFDALLSERDFLDEDDQATVLHVFETLLEEIAADALGVSSQDAPAPRQPRVWRDKAGDVWREKLGEPPTLVVLAEWNGRPADPDNGPILLSDVKLNWGPLFEVVTPEVPA